LTRIQDQNFEAYVHANAILWKVMFHELRALTNTTKISDAGLNVNPLEINDLLDHMWNVAVLLIAAATQGDDPWLLFLEKEYLLKLCFLSDIAARHKLYRVAKISYWPSTKQHYANWEATLEPVHLATLGELYVADEDVIVGPRGMHIDGDE
jgi:hypothetical protein